MYKYKEFHNENNYYLAISSVFFLFGFIYFLLFSIKNVLETALAMMLFICFVVSSMFWCYPIQNSAIHMVDGFFAKIAMLFFVVYTILFKNMDTATTISYIALITLTLTVFYYSNHYSSNDWCCDKHIYYHVLMHTSSFIGITYAFYPH
jgi:hypothetical protein